MPYRHERLYRIPGTVGQITTRLTGHERLMMNTEDAGQSAPVEPIVMPVFTEASMDNVGRCKDCNFWDDGECSGVGLHDAGFGWEQNPSLLFDIDVKADDDSGLECRLKTGPDFGCVRFASKDRHA